MQRVLIPLLLVKIEDNTIKHGLYQQAHFFVNFGLYITSMFE